MNQNEVIYKFTNILWKLKTRMINRPSRTLKENRDPSKFWLDKNEVHDNKIHQFLIDHVTNCPQRTFSSYPDLSETYRLLERQLNLPIDQL